MNPLRASLLSMALVLVAAPASADCVSGTRTCRDTITRARVLTNQQLNVFVALGDHEDISPCNDTNGLTLQPTALHYDQAFQTLLISAAAVITVEVTVDASCNITTVVVDP